MMQGTKNILLIGAGGHCLSVLDSLLFSYDYDKIGIVDKMKDKTDVAIERDIMGVPIVGADDDLEALYNQGYNNAFITVGSIGDYSIRKRLYDKIKKIGFTIPNIIDKSSILGHAVSLGEGNYIGKGSIVNSGVIIGNMTIINTGTIIEHECIIEDYVHLAPNSVACGNVHVKSETHIGAGSILKQGITIGNHTMIGMGSVVLKDISSNKIAYGNPCKEVEND